MKCGPFCLLHDDFGRIVLAPNAGDLSISCHAGENYIPCVHVRDVSGLSLLPFASKHKGVRKTDLKSYFAWRVKHSLSVLPNLVSFF